MNFRIFKISDLIVLSRTQTIELSMIKKIKICLYLLLVDHIFLLNSINCTQSLDVDSISEATKDLRIEKHIKLSNLMKTFRANESTIKCQEQKDLESHDEKFTCTSSNNVFPSTTEIDPLPSKIRSLEDKINNVDMNLGILQHTIIPNLCKVCNEIKDLYTKINEKIKEIKESSKNYDPELIDKIEQKNIENIKVFNKNSAIIENMRLRTEKLILAFEKSVGEYREINVHHKSNAFMVICKIKYDLASEICKENNQSLEDLKIVQDKFQSYKAQVESILVLLFKFLKMTPETFKADEKVKKVLFFFN